MEKLQGRHAELSRGEYTPLLTVPRLVRFYQAELGLAYDIGEISVSQKPRRAGAGETYTANPP
jgi:hypothetical protein